MRIKLLTFFLLVTAVCLADSYMLEIGGGRVTDTYLSPLRYRGLSAGVSGEWTGRLAKDWQSVTDARLQYVCASPRYLNTRIHSADLTVGWSAMLQFTLPAGVSCAAGPGVSLKAGAAYLPVNSNNPADATAMFGLTLNLMASRGFTIKGFPLRLTDRLGIGAAGLAFAPQYGEGYYEISLGNRSGLVHPTWFGNLTALDNLLAIDLPAGRKRSLRVGYRFTLTTSDLCGNNRLTATHALCIGINTQSLTHSK